MTESNRRMAQDGYKPMTEGYQPGKQQLVQKGYKPESTTSNAQQQSTPSRPPGGGSSASKPPRK